MNNKHLISIVIPVFNEEAIIKESLDIITSFLKSRSDKYISEIVLINDGSTDKTGYIADSLVENNELLRIIHHPRNLNLGRALQTGFKNAKGEIIVVMDIDLSYSVDHIDRLVDKQIETKADIVIASPYMKHGTVTGVPFKRALFSRTVNLFMRFVTQEKYHTFTGMVRAYKSEFIKSVNLKTIDYEINPEILYKAAILRARIIEIPGHLDWSFQNNAGKKRTSSIRIKRGFFSGLMSGFIFKPYFFFISLGVVLFLVASYIIIWIFINTFQIMPHLQIDPQFIDDRFSAAVGQVFEQRPYAFIIGGITLMLSLQILSLGFLSLQSKRYFEELFHINSKILNKNSGSGEKQTSDL